MVCVLLMAAPADAWYRDEVRATIFYSYGEPGDFGQPYGVTQLRVRCGREVTTWTDDLGLRARARVPVCRARFRLLHVTSGRGRCFQRWVFDRQISDVERSVCRFDAVSHLLLGEPAATEGFTRDGVR